MILPLRFFDFFEFFLRLLQFLDLVVRFCLLGAKEGSEPHYQIEELWYPQEKLQKNRKI